MEKETALKLFNLNENELTQDTINRAYDSLVGTVNNDVIDEAKKVLLETVLSTSRGTYNLASISIELDNVKQELNDFSTNLEESLKEATRITDEIKELKDAIKELENQKVQIANKINQANDNIYSIEKNIDELEIQKQILADEDDKKKRKERIEELNLDIKTFNKELDEIYEKMQNPHTTTEEFDLLKRQRDGLLNLVEEHKKELASLEFEKRPATYKKKIIKKVVKKVVKKPTLNVNEEVKNDHPIKVDAVEEVQNVEEFRNKDEIKEIFAPTSDVNYEPDNGFLSKSKIEDYVANNDVDYGDEVYNQNIGNIEVSIPTNNQETDFQFEQPTFDNSNINNNDDVLTVNKGNYEWSIPTDNQEESILSTEEPVVNPNEPDLNKEITFEEEPNYSINIDPDVFEDANVKNEEQPIVNEEVVVNNEEQPIINDDAVVQNENNETPAETPAEIPAETPQESVEQLDDLNFTGIQVTKSFMNDMKNSENGAEIKTENVEVVQKPLGFMGRIKQKFNNVVHGKAVQEAKDKLKKACEEAYIDNLKIEKVNNELSLLDKFSPQIVDYEKLLAKLYAGKKGKTEYIDYLTNQLTGFENVYPGIKDETLNSIALGLPTDVDYDISSAITEVVNSNESNAYTDDDVNALDDFVRNMNEIKGLGQGMSR